MQGLNHMCNHKSEEQVLELLMKNEGKCVFYNIEDPAIIPLLQSRAKLARILQKS
jgi:hypothetical protein